MKILVFLLSTAFASTTVTFSKDGQRATVAMTSMSANPDAINLFNVLTQPPQDFGGRQSKRMSFSDDSGSKALDISCLVSDAYKNLGNCTVTFYCSGSVILNSAQGQIALLLEGTQAARLAKEFHIQGQLVYRSDDQRLEMTAGRADFQVQYR